MITYISLTDSQDLIDIINRLRIDQIPREAAEGLLLEFITDSQQISDRLWHEIEATLKEAVSKPDTKGLFQKEYFKVKGSELRVEVQIAICTEEDEDPFPGEDCIEYAFTRKEDLN